MNITINLLALGLAITAKQAFTKESKIKKIYNELREIEFIRNIEKDLKQEVITEIAITAGLYFTINTLIGGLKK